MDRAINVTARGVPRDKSKRDSHCGHTPSWIPLFLRLNTVVTIVQEAYSLFRGGSQTSKSKSFGQAEIGPRASTSKRGRRMRCYRS